MQPKSLGGHAPLQPPQPPMTCTPTHFTAAATDFSFDLSPRPSVAA